MTDGDAALSKDIFDEWSGKLAVAAAARPQYRLVNLPISFCISHASFEDACQNDGKVLLATGRIPDRECQCPFLQGE